MADGSEKFYDRLTFLYPVVDIFLKPQKRRFFSYINAFPPGRLLEIGAGNGAHFKYYRNHGVTAIDSSRGMLLKAARHRHGNIQLLHMNGESLLFPGESFDYVVLSHVIAVVADPGKLLAEAHRVLKPKGKVFILNHFTPDNWLKYVDRAAQRLSRLLHFRSVFHRANLDIGGRFRLLSEYDGGFFSYFKIVVYEKNG